ncbi:PREDICTED: ankyrin-3-like [Priapulus caudatus]|uniref:Ankyrin-3-like n=1 Tax=Priapulus caudatus TaxID=37621 RepID=A0ABM1FBV2_PRICU|nr:PREDICTED: ankyrin-3-like [Priapulus caudatus]XP_014681923.1 PREDICTED: ankyrin-3-like [Priapulus caudatus]XP_014681924.1 PREDICTED: ankyrin-3-like [Priapulus caudatus]
MAAGHESWSLRIYNYGYTWYLTARQYFPLRILIPYRVSNRTQEAIGALFQAVKSGEQHTRILEHILSDSVPGDDLLFFKSPRGYNILQEAAMHNNLPLVRLLLNHNCNPNAGDCSLPLSVACKSGVVDVVELLLAHNARIDQVYGMCYPNPHMPVLKEKDMFGRESRHYQCETNAQLPIYHAIESDRPDVISMLLAHEDNHWLKWQAQKPLLHLACEMGSLSSMKLLAKRRHGDLDLMLADRSPLHRAIEHGPRYVSVLVGHGADTAAITSHNQTSLHLVFTSTRNFFNIYRTLHLLLAHGAAENVNLMDKDGNTPLHLLLQLIFSAHKDDSLEGRFPNYEITASLFVSTLIDSVTLLLAKGANPNIQDNNGFTALHLATTEIISGLQHVDHPMCPSNFEWCSYEMLYQVLSTILTSYRYMNTNLLDQDGMTPLLILFRSLMTVDLLELDQESGFSSCVEVLCKHGADANIAQNGQFTTLNILIFVASDIIHNTTVPLAKDRSFKFINDMLELLLMHGLDPNLRFSKRTQHALLSLMDMVHNALTPDDLVYVYQLTATLLRFGSDPNIDISTTEPMICHSQSSVFLKKSSGQVLYYYVQILARNDHLLCGHAYLKLLYLYFYAMSHRELWNSLRILNAQTALIPTNQELTIVLHELSTTPRTLKQNARIAIYEALRYRLVPRVSQLPLPTLLKNYLLNFEH